MITEQIVEEFFCEFLQLDKKRALDIFNQYGDDLLRSYYRGEAITHWVVRRGNVSDLEILHNLAADWTMPELRKPCYSAVYEAALQCIADEDGQEKIDFLINIGCYDLNAINVLEENRCDNLAIRMKQNIKIAAVQPDKCKSRFYTLGHEIIA